MPLSSHFTLSIWWRGCFCIYEMSAFAYNVYSSCRCGMSQKMSMALPKLAPAVSDRVGWTWTQLFPYLPRYCMGTIIRKWWLPVNRGRSYFLNDWVLRNCASHKRQWLPLFPKLNWGSWALGSQNNTILYFEWTRYFPIFEPFIDCSSNLLLPCSLANHTSEGLLTSVLW